MAWMKIELELPDKPEVHYIAGVTNLDPDSVVGKLIRVWQWFDKHTTDGNAVGVTFSLPDRISGVTGFGEAMSLAGWLIQDGHTLKMPKFDRHNGESAKKRALTAERVAKSKKKSNAEANASSVTSPLPSALPREEKIRDKNLSPDGEFKKLIFDLAKELDISGSVIGKAIKDVGEYDTLSTLEWAKTTDNPKNAFIGGIKTKANNAAKNAQEQESWI